MTEGRLNPWRAAERLDLTTRKIRRLVARYRESGAPGLISRNRGMPGNRRLDGERARRALAIVRERYVDFGPMQQCVRRCASLARLAVSQPTGNRRKYGFVGCLRAKRNHLPRWLRDHSGSNWSFGAGAL
ncbi:helix-turn-helix domain-containing protein [Paraburkholderia terrae]